MTPLNLLSRQLIGMVHVRALPGTPRDKGYFEKVIETAVHEAVTLEKAGFTAILLENMHDVPYLKTKVGPEITASMAVIAQEVREKISLPMGIQILAGANEEALSVAVASQAQFIRVEGFVFSHIADEGFIDSCAGKLMRLRKELGAEKIKILADIKKKHSSHAVTADISISETAQAAEFFGADGVILTGHATGRAASAGELTEVLSRVNLPVWIGSGITANNISNYIKAQGWIVGSSLKKDNHWDNPLNPESLKRMVSSFLSFSI